MSDVTPPPPKVTPTPEDGEFSQLIAVILDSKEFLWSLLNKLTDVPTEPEIPRGSIPALQDEILETADNLAGEIRRGEYGERLHRHSLGNEDTAWRFKYLGYVGSRERFEGRVNERPAVNEESLRKHLHWAKHPLQWLNVILGSLSDVIPAAGVYKELKDSTEAAVDDVLDTEP